MAKTAIEIITLIALGALVWLGEAIWRRYKFPTIVVSADGITVKQWGSTVHSLRWTDVHRVDAGIEGVSYLGVRLFADEVFELWDTYHGFGDFVHAILNRWPQIKPAWDRLTGAESGFWLTLWEQS